MKFQFRQLLAKKAGGKYKNRIEQKLAQEANKPEQSYALNPTDEIFKGDLLEKALEVQKKFETSNKNEEITERKIKQTKKKPVTKKAVLKKKDVKKNAALKKKIKST